MKKLSVLVIAIVGGIYLSACSAQVLVSPNLAITPGTLDTAEAYLARGDQYSNLEDYDHAIADYSQAIQLIPDFAEAYNNRGYAYYWKGDAAHAIADYTLAIELRPNYAYAYNNRGAAYMASGHPNQAIRDLTIALQLQPDFPQAYTNRGNAYLRKGRIDLAMADFEHAGQNPSGLLALLAGALAAMILFAAVIIYRKVGASTPSRK